VLIVGYGGLGQAIEEKMIPFEVEITRVASSARVQEGPAGRPVQVHGLEDLPRLIPHAEIVVLSMPLSKKTYHMVDKAFLAAMADDAMLVNMARGRVVDTDALVAEVNSGRLRAALDVTDPEPLPAGHPLWGLPNVVISPHLGGSTSAMFPRIRKLIRQQIERMQAGEPPLNVVIDADQPRV
jgi:phosphoglycerate dehydrogenase-like enzyme